MCVKIAIVKSLTVSDGLLNVRYCCNHAAPKELFRPSKCLFCGVPGETIKQDLGLIYTE